MDNRRRRGHGWHCETSDMKLRSSCQNNSAITRIEVIVIIGVIVILMVGSGVFDRGYPARPKPVGVVCENNLKIIGLSCRIWSGDARDIFPMGISVTNGGALELTQTGNVVSAFLLMSNELSTPKIWTCPADTNRIRATAFSNLTSSNISYFVNADTINSDNPQLVLSGDCNLQIGASPVKSGLLLIRTNDSVTWVSARHGKFGYILFADGSVRLVASTNLSDCFPRTGVSATHLAIP